MAEKTETPDLLSPDFDFVAFCESRGLGLEAARLKAKLFYLQVRTAMVKDGLICPAVKSQSPQA